MPPPVLVAWFDLLYTVVAIAVGVLALIKGGSLLSKTEQLLQRRLNKGG
jgi:hypothetical protein